MTKPKKIKKPVTKNEKQVVHEEDGLQKDWYKEAYGMTLDKLPKFIDKMMHYYEHDYGTCVHAITACSIATAEACGRFMGITGFQASMISILFPRNLFYRTTVTGISIRDWDNMLYPQYEDKFDKIITANMWEAVQKAAAKLLEEHENDGTAVHSDVRAHWESIVAGNVPFGYKVVE